MAASLQQTVFHYLLCLCKRIALHGKAQAHVFFNLELHMVAHL